MFIINVDGETIANDKNHYAQGWSCLNFSKPIEDNSYRYDKFERTVTSNLVLNKNIRAVPYALYACKKGISAQSTGNIICAPGAMAAELCYKEYISEIEDLFNVEIPTEIEVYFYNGLLTGVFSVLELFLSDLLLCMIFTNQKVYERAFDYMSELEGKRGKKTNYSNKDIALQNYFTEGIVYHKFDKVRSIFKRILQIKIPDTKSIKKLYLHKRNNITHRFVFSNTDRMQMTIIDQQILKEFIRCCNEFVQNLMIEINKEYGFIRE